VLNVSILDGWWPEAYDGLNGFAIGHGESHIDPRVQDKRDADNLFRVLEQEVVPTFYDRNGDGLPLQWIQRMKRAIRTLGWRFNTDRMVMNYCSEAYVPAAGASVSDPRRW
jgi:starch phosphorylase